MRKITLRFAISVIALFTSLSGFAYTAEIGYGTSTVWGAVGAVPSITSGTGATESLTSGTGGTLKEATVCNMSNILYYEIGANATYLEGSLTGNSTSSSITSIVLGGSTNNGTNTGVCVTVYSDKYPFDPNSVIGIETYTVVNSTTSWTTYSMSSIPSGTKSFRVYRKVSYDASATKIGSGTVYGAGVTFRLAYVAYTVTDPGTFSSVSTNTISEVTFDGQTIFNPNAKMLKVYDFSGRMVNSSNNDIDFSEKKGIYIVRCETESMKLIVK